MKLELTEQLKKDFNNGYIKAKDLISFIKDNTTIKNIDVNNSSLKDIGIKIAKIDNNFLYIEEVN